MTSFSFGPSSKEFFLSVSVKETGAQRPPSLLKTIPVVIHTAQHLCFTLAHHRGLWVSQGAQLQRIHLPIPETRVHFLGQEDPLEEEMATHSSIPVWEIPCTEEPGGSQGHKESDTTEHACMQGPLSWIQP